MCSPGPGRSAPRWSGPRSVRPCSRRVGCSRSRPPSPGSVGSRTGSWCRASRASVASTTTCSSRGRRAPSPQAWGGGKAPRGRAGLWTRKEAGRRTPATGTATHPECRPARPAPWPRSANGSTWICYVPSVNKYPHAATDPGRRHEALLTQREADSSVELGPDLVPRLLYHPQHRHRLLHPAGLQAAVRIDVDLLGRQVVERPVDVRLHLLHRRDPVRVHVDDAEDDVLGEGVLTKALQEGEAAVGHLEVDLVDRDVQQPRVHVLEAPVAHVGGGV